MRLRRKRATRVISRYSLAPASGLLSCGLRTWLQCYTATRLDLVRSVLCSVAGSVQRLRAAAARLQTLL